MAPLAQYPYNYGAGEDYNRRVDFYRGNSQDPQSIRAQIMALLHGKWVPLNEVPGSHVSVEMISTTGKMQAMIQARAAMTSPQYPPNQTLSSLTLAAQNGVLQQLDRKNGRRIEIENDVGGPNGLERVVHLHIFDPR